MDPKSKEGGSFSLEAIVEVQETGGHCQDAALNKCSLQLEASFILYF